MRAFPRVSRAWCVSPARVRSMPSQVTRNHRNRRLSLSVRGAAAAVRTLLASHDNQLPKKVQTAAKSRSRGTARRDMIHWEARNLWSIEWKNGWNPRQADEARNADFPRVSFSEGVACGFDLLASRNFIYNCCVWSNILKSSKIGQIWDFFS